MDSPKIVSEVFTTSIQQKIETTRRNLITWLNIFRWKLFHPISAYFWTHSQHFGQISLQGPVRIYIIRHVFDIQKYEIHRNCSNVANINDFNSYNLLLLRPHTLLMTTNLECIQRMSTLKIYLISRKIYKIDLVYIFYLHAMKVVVSRGNHCSWSGFSVHSFWIWWVLRLWTIR